uniref:NADH-ubiquinone oxidoreductase chain 6 n=1 Tax=Melasis buprestoides TaxID=195231 RepID=A0A343C385_9COLE|nr:NADH dehydrogenase subunit 6 [Melasis buprestoides]
MLLMLMMNITLMFIFSKHPLSMGLTLMIQTILVTMTIGTIIPSFWYSYIFFLVVVGGLLVMFIYMTSITSNEKFTPSWKTIILLISMDSMIMMLMPNQMNLSDEVSMKWMENLSFFYSLEKYLDFPLSLIFLVNVMYLLITLIAIIKITDINLGPMRKTS